MEKKVLLKDLVENGSHVRKQIISKVVCSNDGVYPIGELWDANKTVNTIVNGASIALDTLKETEDELSRLDQAKADKATTISGYGITDAYTKTEVDSAVQAVPGQTYSTTAYTVNTDTVQGDVTINGTIPVHVLTAEADITSISLSQEPGSGHCCNVIITAAESTDVTIVHNSESLICPGAADITVTIPAGGYAEFVFTSAADKIFVKNI